MIKLFTAIRPGRVQKTLKHSIWRLLSGSFQREIRGVISQIKWVSCLIQALKTMISSWICLELKAACLAVVISCALTKKTCVGGGMCFLAQTPVSEIQLHANVLLMHCNTAGTYTHFISCLWRRLTPTTEIYTRTDDLFDSVLWGMSGCLMCSLVFNFSHLWSN